MSESVRQGATVLRGGGQHSLGGRFFAPTLLTDVTPEMACFGEEVFGPVSACARYAHSPADDTGQASGDDACSLETSSYDVSGFSPIYFVYVVALLFLLVSPYSLVTWFRFAIVWNVCSVQY